MLIYETLKKDHDTVKALLDDLLALADDDSAGRQRMVAKIRDELIPHSRAEEEVLYNSMRMLDSAKKIAMHGYTEHMEAEMLLRTLQLEDKINMSWRETAVKLQESLYHHIHEEETEMFEAARQLFTDEEAEAMSEVFESLKPEVKQEGFVMNTFDMMKNLMPPRLMMALTPNASKPNAN